MFKFTKLIIFLLLNLLILQAEDLSIDNQFTDKEKFEISFGVDYINTYANDIGNVNTVLETSYGDYVKVPISYEASTSSDYIGISLSLNYGYSDRLSFFSYASGHYLYIKNINAPDSQTIHSKQFDSLNVGVSYVLKKETKSPAYFVRLSTNAIDRVDFNSTKLNENFTTANLSLGSYFSTDPLTFMFQTTYIYSRTLTNNSVKIKDGDIVIISPSIYFNINPYTTLNFDLQWQHMEKNKENSKYTSKNRNEVKKGIGVIYEISKDKTISIDYSYKSTSVSSDTISLVYTYKI